MVWRILVIDDDPDIASQVVDLLASAGEDESGDALYAAVAATSFDDALTVLDQGHFDLLVLDVRDQRMAEGPEDSDSADRGITAFSAVRGRRFIPIVFYTALPELVEDLAKPPFVAVVSKIDSNAVEALRRTVADAFASSLPTLNRALVRHVEGVTRDFMANFVEGHWPQLEAPVRRGDLAHLLLRRLAVSLASGAQILAGELDNTDEATLDPEAVHPMRFYIVPPVGDFVTGDLVRGLRIDRSDLTAPKQVSSGDERTESVWYVLLTPACDLVTSRKLKAEFVVVAECLPLASFPEVLEWQAAVAAPAGDANASKVTKASEKLLRFIRNNSKDHQVDRYYFLPAAWGVPDLVVDLQRVAHLHHSELSEHERVATLDSPYAEALSNRFGRYLGRVGTPDLDGSLALARILDGTQEGLESAGSSGEPIGESQS